MSTLELARKLNCVLSLDIEKKTHERKKQYFDYLLVLDFEATCWEKTAYDKGRPEIIEFPCVLYDIKTNKIIDEFQQYVMPIERPKLTPFCTELTGIEQHQVDSGMPLKTCLYMFNKWLTDLKEKYKFTFEVSVETNFKKCIFATWSDWDLGYCLKKECTRKMIMKDVIFNKWIDIRSLYVSHFQTKPKGLEGALESLGLTFDGRQHCGLHDARNTAYLIGKMVADGVVLVMTKSLS